MDSDESSALPIEGEGLASVKKPSWMCAHCSLTGESKRSLRRHMRTHALALPPQPRVNSTAEPEPPDAINSRVNPDVSQPNVEPLPLLFPLLVPPIKTSQQHHCTVCGYLAVSAGKLEVHMRSHTGEKPFKCSFCEYACSHKSGLNAHTRKYHTRENLHACPHCPYKALRPGHLERHVRKHTGEKPFQCTMCEASFTCMDYLNDHLRDYHYRERLFQCPHCDKKLSRPGYFEAHLRTHAKRDEILVESVDEIPSSLLTAVTSDLDSTESSIDAMENSLEELPTQALTAEGKINFTGDYNPNEDGKKFSCVLCDFKCNLPQSLRAHVVDVHKKAKPYKCHICPFNCKLPAQLKSHIAIHTGGKPFKCPHCDARFTLQSRLNQHVVVHDEGRRLKCSECDYVCYRNADMRKHMPKHTKVRAFGCPICFKSFTAASSVRQHAKTIHQLCIGNLKPSKSRIRVVSSEMDHQSE